MQGLRVHFDTYRCPVLPLKEASTLNPGFRDLYLKTAEFPFQIVYIQMSILVYIQVQKSVDKEQGKTGGAIVYERERDGDRQYLYQKLLVHVVRRRITYTRGCRTDYTRVKKKKKKIPSMIFKQVPTRTRKLHVKTLHRYIYIPVPITVSTFYTHI